MTTIAEGRDHRTVITTFDTTPGVCRDLREEPLDARDRFSGRQPGVTPAAPHVNDAQRERRGDFPAMLRPEEMRKRNRRIDALARSFAPVVNEVAKACG